MSTEFRFVLTDFRCIGDGGAPRLYEAGRSFPMPPAVAHAAAKRDLVARHKPPNWTAPSILTPPEALTEIEVAAAAAELEALERHAAEPARPAPTT